MNKFFDFRPEFAAFVSGALVMIFELLGARILGVYVGTSLFVWTSIIALVLGALAWGYYIGGQIADRKAEYSRISLLFIVCGFSFLLLPLIKDIVLIAITQHISSIKLSSLIATTILFVPVSFVLGMIQPIATKMRIQEIEKAGSVVGKLSGLGTLGSIIGTLAAGFFLIPFFGINLLLFILAGISFLSAIYISHTDYRSFYTAGIICLLLGYSFISYRESQQAQIGRIQRDTAYSHVSIQDFHTGRETVRNLYIDNITHAGKILGKNELLYPYTRAYHLFADLYPEAKNVIMFGGAAYSFPQNFLKKYPDKKIDVVEIDSGVTQIAREYFGLTDHKNLKIFHEDARAFINKNQKKYDAILGDAFGSYYSVPYQLTTLETVKKKYAMLHDNGVVLLNIIGSLQGEKSQFIQAEYLTYQQVFPEVFLLPIESPDSSELQNIMLVALKNTDSLSFESKNSELQKLLTRKTYLEVEKNTPILTDDYAPVDYFTSKLVE